MMRYPRLMPYTASAPSRVSSANEIDSRCALIMTATSYPQRVGRGYKDITVELSQAAEW